MTFNLRDAITAVLDATDLTDARELADEVYDNLDPNDYAAAIHQALPFIITNMLSHRRQIRVLPNFEQPATSDERRAADELTHLSEEIGISYDGVTAGRPGGGKVRESATRVVEEDRRPASSPKIVALWERRLSTENIAVTQDGSVRKFLRDCTAEDLMAAAHIRRDLAEKNTQSAVEYETLAGLLHTHHVTTVGELRPEVGVATLASA